MSKPSIFIGSSTEGLDFARAVRTSLSDDAEVTLWKDELFGVGHTFIDTLMTALPRFDFAVLVLTTDDLIRSRDTDAFSPRDNVLFELGLFMGRLGRSRTFMIHQRSPAPKIPSDLSGVITATYDWPRQDDKNYLAALGPACDSVRQVIRELAMSEHKTAKAIGQIASRQDSQQHELANHQKQIRFLQVALQGIVTQYEPAKLVGLSGDEPFLCYYSDDLFAEMKRLRAMDLVRNHEGKGLSTLRRDYKDRNRQFDLKQFFFVTDGGREYLTLRREVQGRTQLTLIKRDQQLLKDRATELVCP